MDNFVKVAALLALLGAPARAQIPPTVYYDGTGARIGAAFRVQFAPGFTGSISAGRLTLAGGSACPTCFLTDGSRSLTGTLVLAGAGISYTTGPGNFILQPTGTPAATLTNTALLWNGGLGGISDGVSAGGNGGRLSLSGGTGGDGSGAIAPGNGGGINVFGGPAGTGGGGNANGGTVNVDSGQRSGTGSSTLNLGATNATAINVANGSVPVTAAGAWTFSTRPLGTAPSEANFSAYNAANLAGATALSQAVVTNAATLVAGSNMTHDVAGAGTGTFVAKLCSDGVTCGAGNVYLTCTAGANCATAAAGRIDACTITKSAVPAGTTLTWSVATACGTTDPGVNLNAHYTVP